LIARRFPWWSLLVLGIACVALGGFLALHASSPHRPGPFYAAPSPLPPGPPGTLIREELIPGFYPGTKAYRVLYKSTGFNGRATAVSGVVVVPEGPPPAHGREVVAFAHGTVGVASNCAPSLQNGGFAQIIEGLGEFIAAGYVVAATDYEGLGTPGPNAYLVGRVEAMDVLDSVRTAHRLRQAHAGVDFAVWGHSQGGQASLFTGQLASSYAPALHLVGVAAGAPVPDLVDLFKANLGTTVGKVLISLALSSWARIYHAASLEQIVTPAARPSVEAIAGYCLYGREILASVPSALLLDLSFISSPPWRTEPWRTISEQNGPGATPIGVPILITQGGADKIVPVAATKRLAAKLCAHGETVDLRVYPSVEHLEAGIVVAPDVAAWIAARFAGRPAPSTCR
jgi:alpha-beta hydrolase superfamily lysophospholipase